MNYRHIYHAGNFADAFKHIILMLLTKSFLKKETPFCFLDTHAGIGHYDLMSIEAQKGKEYENGIGKILKAANPPAAISEYIACIQKFNAQTSNNECRFYPGSPEIVKAFLRQNDRMLLCELHPEDYKTLKKYFSRDKQIAVHHQDAYQSFKALLPPKERRGLILIDPPYENTNELSHITTMLPQALSRFETGVYALWYPIKDRPPIERFYRELKEKVSRPILITELNIYPDNISTHLNGCGMLIINPPFQIDQQINEVLPWLWNTLNLHKQSSYQMKFL